MKRCLAWISAFLGGTVLLWLSGAAYAEPQRSHITVHVDQPTVALPQSLYGLFYEDINYSADGGLYAELVENRSFEYYPVSGWNSRKDKLHPLYAWSKVALGDAKVTLTVENQEPLNHNNTNYVVLKIEDPGDGVGLANAGYDGIFVEANETYDFSFYARRSGDFDTLVNVSLQGDEGELATGTIAGLSPNWTKYELSMVANATDEKARLVITTGGRGEVMIDMVSLFPRKTFKGRKNGLRQDLAQSLAELKPAVLRFPGGCIAHGHGLDNAYRWKDTVGDVAERKPNWNLWGYHQTYGLGYFEYFQLCEDLGAEPLPILPVGVSCGFRQPFQNAPMQDLHEWVQDAIDLIEFANGPTDSTWGRVRAEMGHPEPFNLKYIGLGNEDHHTPEFEARFPPFVRALRSEAPEIIIVGTSGLGPGIPIYDFMSKQGCELSDEHYYESPEWFINNHDRFDDFDRSKAKIYVGEYASRGNTLYNAIAEAVYLTGIERNADLVQMTAYAPLFARYGFTQWTDANLIWFDHKQVVRTPNYFVQQLFSVNKGDHYLKNESEFHAELDAASAPALGRIGIGTWLSQAVFDDIKVQSGDQTLIEHDFSTQDDAWKVISGDFANVADAYAQTDQSATPAISVYQKRIDINNVVYSLKAKKTGGAEGFLITFGSKASGDYYWWNIGGWGNSQHAIEQGRGSFIDGKTTLASRRGRIESDVWYDIRIELSGNRIKCFLNDEKIHDIQTPKAIVTVAASRDDSNGDVILKVANPSNASYPTTIGLKGIETVNPQAKLILLSGDKNAKNDLQNPEQIAPVESEIAVSKSFEYTVPAMSVQFIRIRTK